LGSAYQQLDSILAVGKNAKPGLKKMKANQAELMEKAMGQ
jgi:hypothetical protein